MNCPRCGEVMYGSVCPRCGNIVMSGSYTSNSRSNRTSSNVNYGNIQFMDNKRKPSRPAKKKSKSSNTGIYKLFILILIVLCCVFYFKYRSAEGKLAEAQSSINTLNESVKSKDAEINKLKTASVEAQKEETTESDSPSVEFDENGNLLNISEDSKDTKDSSDDADSSDTSDSENSDEEEQIEYKSGDVYTVKEGDTGADICNKIYGEYKEELWEKLLAANGMTASSSYHPGDELKIP